VAKGRLIFKITQWLKTPLAKNAAVICRETGLAPIAALFPKKKKNRKKTRPKKKKQNKKLIKG